MKTKQKNKINFYLISIGNFVIWYNHFIIQILYLSSLGEKVEGKVSKGTLI